MAISTYKSFLMIGTDTGSGISYEKLVDIKSFPDLGGVPETLDTTTMSDSARTFILGIQETESMTFDANYDLADYGRIKALEYTIQHFAVWLGADVVNEIATPTGVSGKFEFDGYITVTKTGGGVNEVQNMTITIAPTTVIRETAGGGGNPSVTLSTHIVNVVEGNTVKIKAFTNPADASVTWSSASSLVATVANGIITAEGDGNTIITASITEDGVTYNDTCTVIVAAAE